MILRRARDSSRHLPWREAGWCAVDLELTGLRPGRDEIIAVGAVPIEDGRLLLGESLYTLVRTAQRSEYDAIVLHKLRTLDVADAPPLEDALDMLLERLDGRVPVYHAATIEETFLTPPLARRGVRLPRAADTDALGRVWLATRQNLPPGTLSLSGLARTLGQEPEPVHHALGDAVTTAQVFITLCAHLDGVRPQTVGSIVGARDRWRPLRRMA